MEWMSWIMQSTSHYRRHQIKHLALFV